jgi:translation initiation factor 2B subunit (eIF-2B alpha/beta/delta family)
MPEPPELKAIVHDHQSGAREIAQRLLRLLQRQATQSQAEAPTALMEDRFDTGGKVVRAHPEMAVLFNTVDAVFRRLEEQEDVSDVGAFRMEAVALLGEQERSLERSLVAAAEEAARRIDNGHVVATYSRSSTVERALMTAKAAGRLFDVVATESRPLLEGRTLAKVLAEQQVPVRVMVDAALGDAVANADLIMVGADAITQDGFVNKVGTRLVAMAAREAGVPVYVVAEAAKAWRRKAEPPTGVGPGGGRDPKEVWDRPPHGVDVVNVTYDRTPSRLATAVVSEHGAETFDGFWGRIGKGGYARRVRQTFSDELV